MRRAFAAVLVGAVAGACASFGADATPGSDDDGGAGVDGGHDAASASDAPAVLPSDAGGDSGPDPLADMVAIPGAHYAIDAHETTVGEWNDFKANAGMVLIPPSCPRDGGSSGPCAPSLDLKSPITCVDWCDAVEYCAWRGKHLCGALNQAVALSMDPDAKDETQDQWTHACMGTQTGDSTKAWCYGSMAVKTSCNTMDNPNILHGAPVEVGTLPGCQGGVAGIFDMSGNVSEWEDVCHVSPPDSNCLVRGGSFLAAAPAASCGALIATDPTKQFADVGIRCCLETR